MVRDKFFNLAFTLAEVLIVLAIIGVVAALTIPTVILKSQDKATVTALKKEISVLQQGIKMAIVNEGNIEDWYSGSDGAAALSAVNGVFAKYFKLSKNCGSSTSGCLPSEYGQLNKSLAGTDYDSDTSYSKIVLADGSILFFSVSVGGDNYIESINIKMDVNGLKGPNREGYDLFTANILSDAYAKTGGWPSQVVTPSGTTSGAISMCSTSGAMGAGQGSACTSWAYYQGNREYLYCTGLDWSTKTSCN